MNELARFSFVCLALVACGGHTIPTNEDAGSDASGPISQCHGYCPQPNGASCTSDCDCQNKCIAGVCTDPVAPTVSCAAQTDAAPSCPVGEQCAAWGVCEGASCGTDSDCPIEQACIAGACHAMGCI